MRQLVRVLIYLIAPAISLLLAAPAASTLLPWNFQHVDAVQPLHFLLLAFYFGVLSAPGYVYAFQTRARAREVSMLARWWVRSSLVVAAICGFVGVIAGLWMVFFTPPSLLALYASLSLLGHFEAAS